MLQDVNYFGTMQVAAGDADGLVSGCTPSSASSPALDLVHDASSACHADINAGSQRCPCFCNPECTSGACLTRSIMVWIHAIPRSALRAGMSLYPTPARFGQLTTR